MTNVEPVVPSGSSARRSWSPSAVILASVAWILPTVIALIAAGDAPVDPRINYLVVPALYLAIFVFLTRYWYGLKWGEVGIPGETPGGDITVSAVLAALYLFFSQAATGPSLSEGMTNLLEAWRASQLQFIGRLLLYPIVEELFFRGVAFQVFFRRYNQYVATLVTSLLFASVHLSLAEAPFLFIVGLFLGWCMWGSGSTLFAPIIFHVTLALQYLMSG